MPDHKTPSVILICIAVALVAYFLGSIPTGYLVGKAKGIDLRTMGSGNIGATNAFRILGKPAGIFVLVVDGLKGWMAVALVPGLIYGLLKHSTDHLDPETEEYLKMVAGISVILGHNYTCWLKFKGGKGIATSAGVLAALIPIAFMVGLFTWIIVSFATRYVSVGSIAAALSLPIATLIGHYYYPANYSYRLVLIAAIMGALAIYKHKGNIERLRNGTENKIGRKKTPPPTGVSS
ncbi:MAG: acyl-phosphate glycerol 3-phosphate acyltransferase [Pedosphaera sp.]|nr:acyl-phosphate glycerol 3-phosphate acyltransferase [Pedosphaera sp.]